jgi:hypothetical protein
MDCPTLLHFVLGEWGYSGDETQKENFMFRDNAYAGVCLLLICSVLSVLAERSASSEGIMKLNNIVRLKQSNRAPHSPG